MPFSPSVSAQKGITREAVDEGTIDAAAREKLLNAIRRASRWVEAVRSGRAQSFGEIADQEELDQRHVRWLTPLAFVSPTVLRAIMDASAPAALTVGALAKQSSHSWAAQKKILG
jgi:site-specific DNA recombinase